MEEEYVSDIILKRHKQGDYIITGNGYKILTALSELNCGGTGTE